MDRKIKIMPCLDMQNGRVVKGVHFVDIADAGDPVAVTVTTLLKMARCLLLTSLQAVLCLADATARVFTRL